MEVELHVTFQDVTSAFKFPFAEFPFVTIRWLKQIVATRQGAPPGTNLRIFRAVSAADAPEPQFEELANNGTLHDYNVPRGALLVASTQPLVVPQKNLTEAEIDRTIHVFNWVPPPGAELTKMVADMREVFGSFGPIHRVILSSLAQDQREFTAIVTFDTRAAAQAATAAMQSPAIVKALQEVTMLNKDISVFTAVRNLPAGDAGDAGAAEEGEEGQEGKEEEEEEAEAAAQEQDAAAGGAASTDGAPADAAAAQTLPAPAQLLQQEQQTQQKQSLAHAVHMAKSQLIHGYLDGRQGVALISWTAEPVPLRALMGRAAAEPVGRRVKTWASDKAKVVGGRVQGAAKNALNWFKRTTTKENLKAVKAKVAATARGVQADIKSAARVVKTTAVKATGKVKQRLRKNSGGSGSGGAGTGEGGNAALGAQELQAPATAAGRSTDEEPAETHDERQLFFLRQAEAEAAAAAGASGGEGGTAGAADAAPAGEGEAAADAAEPNPPAHLTFDDI